MLPLQIEFSVTREPTILAILELHTSVVHIVANLVKNLVMTLFGKHKKSGHDVWEVKKSGHNAQ